MLWPQNALALAVGFGGLGLTVVGAASCSVSLHVPGRLHPAVLQEYDTSLPAAPAESEALPSQDFQRWLTSIYSRFNPSLLPKASGLNRGTHVFLLMFFGGGGSIVVVVPVVPKLLYS